MTSVSPVTRRAVARQKVHHYLTSFCSRMLRWFRAYSLSLIFIVSLGGVWQLVATISGLQSYILPKPSSIIYAAVASDRSVLLANAQTTLFEIVVGFVLAVASGFLVAVLLASNRMIRSAIYPVVVSSQTIPTLAIAPLLVIWFGFGPLPKVLVVAVFGFFPVAVSTLRGIESVEDDTIRLMRSLGAGRWATFIGVRLPAALPTAFSGVRLAAVYAPIGAITGEWVGAQNGLGPLMINANSTLDTALVFAAILYLTVIAIALVLTVSVVEHYAIPWYFLVRSEA